jgi:GT2 family glycosyltransferase
VTASQPRVTIAIPAYRNAGLRACLDAIAAMDPTVPFETIVVLNDATDEVRDLAQARSDAVRLAEVPVNLGVAGAFNHGFGLGTGEFLLQLQDDSIPAPDLLTVLVARAEAGPDAGAIGALTVNQEGEVSDPGWVVRRDGVTFPGLVGGSRDPDDYRECRAIDYHGSAGMLIRRRAWESVGGLDDGFYPAYYGDVDLCFRLRERGWRILLEPRARVRHAGGASTTSRFRAFLGTRLRERFVERHHAALDRHGEFDQPTMAAVNAEVERAAAVEAGAPPPPPTPAELAQLRARLDIDALGIAKRERDVHGDYARHLEGALRSEEEHARARIEDVERRLLGEQDRLADARARIESAEQELGRTRAELVETHRALRDALGALDQMSRSRSWRYTGWLRRLRHRG